MPNILLEGMAMGMPIACSNYGPMPEMLGNSGEYFNPEDPKDIAFAINNLVSSLNLRQEYTINAFNKAKSLLGNIAQMKPLSFLRK